MDSAGGVRQHLKQHGFTSVYNRREDCERRFALFYSTFTPILLLLYSTFTLIYSNLP